MFLEPQLNDFAVGNFSIRKYIFLNSHAKLHQLLSRAAIMMIDFRIHSTQTPPKTELEGKSNMTFFHFLPNFLHI